MFTEDHLDHHNNPPAAAVTANTATTSAIATTTMAITVVFRQCYHPKTKAKMYIPTQNNSISIKIAIVLNWSSRICLGLMKTLAAPLVGQQSGGSPATVTYHQHDTLPASTPTIHLSASIKFHLPGCYTNGQKVKHLLLPV